MKLASIPIAAVMLTCVTQAALAGRVEFNVAGVLVSAGSDPFRLDGTRFELSLMIDANALPAPTSSGTSTAFYETFLSSELSLFGGSIAGNYEIGRLFIAFTPSGNFLTFEAVVRENGGGISPDDVMNMVLTFGPNAWSGFDPTDPTGVTIADLIPTPFARIDPGGPSLYRLEVDSLSVAEVPEPQVHPLLLLGLLTIAVALRAGKP